MKRYTVVLFVFLFVFYSCQKEDFNDMNFKLETYNPVSVSQTQWTISGRVISAGKVEASAYGFTAMIGSEAKSFPVGETLDQLGKVQTVIDAPANTPVYDVKLYLIDKNGKNYTSTVSLPVSITYPEHSGDAMSETFVANILNGHTGASGYAVQAYGIRYRLKGTAAWTKREATSAYYEGAQTPALIQITKNLNVFNAGSEYEYVVYAKYCTQYLPVFYYEVNSGINTFTATPAGV